VNAQPDPKKLASHTFSSVLKDERKEISTRREVAGFTPNSDGDGQTDSADSPVGLALSGGGIRSASFGLGLLQSFYQKGILRHIDYISTVSGGGYAGAFLTRHTTAKTTVFNPHTRKWEVYSSEDAAKVARQEYGGAQAELKPDAEPEQTASKEPEEREEPDRFPLDEDGSGKQLPAVHRLISGGMYLKRPLYFLNRYVSGLIVLNLFTISGLIASMALLAVAYRCLDYRPVIHFLSAAGFQGDILRAFVPGTFCCLFWLFSWICYRLRASARRHRGEPPPRGTLTRCGCALFLFSMGMGIAALMGTGDISLSGVVLRLEPDAVAAAQRSLHFALLIIFAIAMLPYLRPDSLIRSGIDPGGAVESMIFAIASRALLFGAPFVLFSFIAKEDISHHIKDREDRSSLSPQHIAAWPAFWMKVEAERLDNSSSQLPGKPLWNAACNARASKEHPFDANENPINQTIRLEEDLQRLEKIVAPWKRFGHYREIRTNRFKLDVWRQAIVGKLNDSCLSHPRLYLYFSKPMDSDESSNPAFLNLRREARELERVHRSATGKDLTRVQKGIRRVNRGLLSAHYGELIHSQDKVFAYIVHDADQGRRLSIFLVALAIFVGAGLIIDLNGVSVFEFYRDRLTEMWVMKDKDDTTRIALQELDTSRNAMPYHLINATLNHTEDNHHSDREPTAPFVFSRQYCGSELTGFEKTDDYMDGKLTLADAMAVSGAAVSPSAVNNPLLITLLLILNLRLGRWVANPGRAKKPTGTAAWFLKFNPNPPFVIAFQHFRRSLEKRLYSFVTDGGHHENTGIGQLLLRRCRIIVASDASMDRDSNFADFLRLVRRSRICHGIRFTHAEDDNCSMSLDELIAGKKTRRSKCHVTVAKIHYPNDACHEATTGYLILLKPSFTGDEGMELVHYHRDQSSFPHDSTVDQFYDETRFDAYRRLGHHIGNSLCAYLEEPNKENSIKPNYDTDRLELANWSPPALSVRQFELDRNCGEKNNAPTSLTDETDDTSTDEVAKPEP
jgi:hypothetical protein